MKLSSEHFLEVTDLTNEEILEILELARLVKSQPLEYSSVLKNKKIGLYFQKPSMRTRVSFEVGVHELGANPISLNASEIQLGTREPIEDVSQVLSRYIDGIVMRVYSHSDLERFSKTGNLGVINGLSDMTHPCQALADAQTIIEKKGSGRHKLVYVGDGNNVCNSLLRIGKIIGLDMTVACPPGYEPFVSRSEVEYVIEHDPLKAVENADVIYTDVWTSMGREKETYLRKKIFASYQVNSAMLNKAKSDCIFMHCLPAHRGEEVSESVMSSPNCVVVDQAENRLHAQKALMIKLFS